jgi:hypothetical protein
MLSFFCKYYKTYLKKGALWQRNSIIKLFLLAKKWSVFVSHNECYGSFGRLEKEVEMVML